MSGTWTPPRPAPRPVSGPLRPAFGSGDPQVARAQSMVGRRVRFAHVGFGAPRYRVLRATAAGMLEIEHHVGEFAPHLFVVVHDGKA